MSFESSVHAKAIELTRLNVEITTAAGSGHPTSGASLAHITTILLYSHMRHDPAHPGHPGADRLVLSEGHAVPILYAAAADLGIMAQYGDQFRPTTREDVLQLRAIDSPIDGHPNPEEGFPFFDAATGSLGQGLSVAAGIAEAARLDGLDKRVFCVIGDGESREGQIWEAAEHIADRKLAAVCPIFNCNKYAQSDAVSPLQSAEVTAAKLKAIGFTVSSIDGHNPAQVQAAFDAHARNQAGDGKPFAIVATTIKGWGAAAMQQGNQHGSAMKADKVEHIMAELTATSGHLGAAWVPGDLRLAPITNPAPTPPNRRASRRSPKP
jgi:transketolase